MIAEDNTLWLSLACLLVIVSVTGCASLPELPPKSASTPPLETRATALGRALAPVIAEHPGLSGVYSLERSMDAFAARMVLATAAERALDVQYYIWHPDDAGKLLANQLIQAAHRGVRVRLLLDDFGANPSDAHVLALDSTPTSRCVCSIQLPIEPSGDWVSSSISPGSTDACTTNPSRPTTRSRSLAAVTSATSTSASARASSSSTWT